MADWVEKVDTTSGRTYYVNQTTKQPEWTKPAELESGGRDATAKADAAKRLREQTEESARAIESTKKRRKKCV